MTTKFIILISIITIGCHQTSNKKNISKPAIKVTNAQQTRKHIPPLNTHLHDTAFIKGSIILFLFPDGDRLDSYTSSKELQNIYKSESDFLFGVRTIKDNLKKENKFKGIQAITTMKRYIIIKDCNTCPLILDRDTVNYGFILSCKEKSILTKYDDIHIQNYFSEISKYFE